MKNLREAIFFSDEVFLTSGGDMYLHHNWIFLTNATTVTVHRRQDMVVLEIAFPYKVSSTATLLTYGFGDWWKGTPSSRARRLHYSGYRKKQLHPETRLKSVELDKSERLRVYRGIVDINSPMAASRIHWTVTRSYKSGHLKFSDFVYTFHVQTSIPVFFSWKWRIWWLLDNPQSKEEEEEETETDGASLKSSLLLLLMLFVFWIVTLLLLTNVQILISLTRYSTSLSSHFVCGIASFM